MRYTMVFNRYKSQVSKVNFSKPWFFNFLPGWVVGRERASQTNHDLQTSKICVSWGVSEEDPCFFSCIKPKRTTKTKGSYLTSTISTPQNLTPWTLRNLARFTSQLSVSFSMTWGKMLAHWESQLNPQCQSFLDPDILRVMPLLSPRLSQQKGEFQGVLAMSHWRFQRAALLAAVVPLGPKTEVCNGGSHGWQHMSICICLC